MLNGGSPKIDDYQRVFAEECSRSYCSVREFEVSQGYAIDRRRLEEAAWVLACPVKVNPPNWQHGRVIYSILRKLLAEQRPGNLVDIGTAKGFSAVVASWALVDAGVRRSVFSVDVIHPEARQRRNSVAELSGFKTISEFTGPFLPLDSDVRFFGGGSALLLDHLRSAAEHIMFAFVDGKHTTEAVRSEALALHRLQEPGDVILFDDCQIEPVNLALKTLKGYSIKYLQASATRKYAIATRL